VEVLEAPHFVRPRAAPDSGDLTKTWCITKHGTVFARKYAAEWTKGKLLNLRQQLAKHIESVLSKKAPTNISVDVASLHRETDFDGEDLMTERMELSETIAFNHDKEIIGEIKA